MPDHKQQFWWITQIDTNPFCVYEGKIQQVLESAYRQFVRNKKPTSVKIKYLHREYLIDLEKMTQGNTSSKKTRPVSRILI